jgi:hypothetical protein
LSGNPTLEPGNYVVAGLSTLDDFITTALFPGYNGSLALAPGIQHMGNRTNNSTQFGYPSAYVVELYIGGFGANFQFDNAESTPAPSAPEPSTVLFSGLGCLIWLGGIYRYEK